MNIKTAAGEWTRLDGLRAGMMSRLERLSQLSIPWVLPPDNYDSRTDQLTNGHSSLGCQVATHLVNKLMLALFAPSRPYFRLDMPRKDKQKLIEALGIEEDVITDTLAVGEQEALQQLENAGRRSTLFTLLAHLVTVGTVLMDLSEDDINCIGIRDFVVRRNPRGKVVTIIIREKYLFDELDPDAQDAYLKVFPNTQPETEVKLYTWVAYNGRTKKYQVDKWVDDILLPKEFSGSYTETSMPYRVLTWQLPAKQHYGVGRCEDYANDLATFEGLAEALNDGAALATVFRWLANPGGITRPEEVTSTPNGGILPGSKDDLSLLYANIGQQLATVSAISQEVQRRIGQGFLLNSAVTRDAERVTAEEIRLQAIELESSLGGTYSRIAVDMQQPLAHWALKNAEVDIKGTKVEPRVITGLDALSRNADRERMMMFLSDVAMLDNIQPDTRLKLRETNIISDMAAGAGVERGKYVASKEEIEAAQQQRQQMALNQQAEAAAIDAAATNVTKGNE